MYIIYYTDTSDLELYTNQIRQPTDRTGRLFLVKNIQYENRLDVHTYMYIDIYT